MLLGEGGAARLVLHQHQRAHQAAGLGLAHQRVVLHFGIALRQVGAHVVVHVGHQPELLDQPHVGQAYRAGHRVAGIGVAVGELAALLDEHPRHPLAHHHAAQRHVAAGHALGESHQVGPEAEGLAAEPAARAAEAADHLVAHQQDAVALADALDLGPVAGRRNDHAAGALYGLADEGGHVLRAQLQDALLQPARGLQAEGFGLQAQGTALRPPAGLLDVGDAGNGQTALRVHARHAAQRGAGHRGAVVRVVAADDDLALGLAQHVPVAAHHAHDGVVALGARAAEKHMLEARRRHLGQQLGQFDGRHGGRLEEGVVEGQLLHLPRGGLYQRLLAVAHVHAPQAAHRVQDALALAVPQIDVVGAGDDARALAGQTLEIGEGVQEMRRVGLLPLRGGAAGGAARGDGARDGGGGNRCGRGCHARASQTCSSRCSRSQGEITFMNSAYSISLTSVYTVTKGCPSTSARSFSARSRLRASPRLRGSW